MRKISFLLMLAAIISASCNNNKPKEITIKDDDGKSTVTVNTDEMTAKADAVTKKIEELKKLSPLSLDELKSMLPEEILSMKRTSFNATSMTGTGMASATYKSDGGKVLNISIYDGAGEAGAGLVGMQFYNLWNFQQEDENGYTKTVDFKGGKAIEKYSKSNEEYGLTYVAKDRYLVSVEGENMGLEGVKAAIDGLNL